MLANTVFTLHIQSIGASNLKVSMKTAIHNMSSPICCFVIQICLLALWICDSYGNQIPSMICPIALRKWDSDPGAQSGVWRSAINIFMIPFLLFKNAYAIPFRNIWLTAKNVHSFAKAENAHATIFLLTADNGTKVTTNITQMTFGHHFKSWMEHFAYNVGKKACILV